MSHRKVMGAAIVAGLIVTACGGDDDGGGGDGLGSGDDYSVAAALSELPADLDTEDAQITTGDLTAASEAAGLERPDSVDDTEAIADWLLPITDAARDEDAGRIAFVPIGEVFGAQILPELPTFEEELGWSVLDADSFVELSHPPTRFSVISGEFDDETLSDDLIKLDNGVLTNKEGEDGEQDLENAGSPAIDRLGRPVRLAQDGERIAVSFQTETVKAWIDGPEESLADDDDLKAVADALDDADVFSALLTVPSTAGSSDAIEQIAGERADVDEIRERLEDELKMLPPKPFRAIGIGWGADDDGGVITIAYQHASEDDAAANAEALETLLTDGTSLQAQRPLSDLYDLQGVETDGTVAVVTARLGPDGHLSAPVQGLYAHDLPFIHA